MWAFDVNAPGYFYNTGTSMAAPHVSGVAALILAQNPSLSVAQLRARLLDFAVDVGAPGPDHQYGAGILNARNSLTQSFAPPRRTFARLYDVATGALVKSISAGVNGSYIFDDLGEGEYHVFGGQDEDDDRQIGTPGRRWGAFGGAAIATPLTVTEGGEHSASFTIGTPVRWSPTMRWPTRTCCTQEDTSRDRSMLGTLM